MYLIHAQKKKIKPIGSPFSMQYKILNIKSDCCTNSRKHVHLFAFRVKVHFNFDW